MKIHEYQAREIFLQYGLPVSEAYLANSPEEARNAAERLGGKVVVKAQVLTGGRGKAGGVKVVSGPDEAFHAASDILSMTIKTFPVENVLVSRAVDIEQEFYLGLTVDRHAKAITLMVSGEGGIEIEDLALNRPEAILKFPINPLTGIDTASLRRLLSQPFSDPVCLEQALNAVEILYRLFVEKDCSLVEINPYARLADGSLVALDAKVILDDNGLYKHPELEALRNPEEYSEDEIAAREVGLAFVSMDGDIGCIVNGAGLAMATMDIIKLFGGKPANFLDVGGSSSPEKVLNALQIIKRNPRLRAILINIFGGITRCDDIAKGILLARSRIDLGVPLVIRLVGTNEKEGREILEKEGLQVSETLTEAVEQVVAAGSRQS